MAEHWNAMSNQTRHIPILIKWSDERETFDNFSVKFITENVIHQCHQKKAKKLLTQCFKIGKHHKQQIFYRLIS